MTERGELTVYLGAAAGAGKRAAMLAEAHRRAHHGADIVIGHLTDDDAEPSAPSFECVDTMAGDTRTRVLDVDAVLARNPQVVLVEDLAGPGDEVAGTRRFEDVQALLEAGIDVITTLNVHDLASLETIVEQATGVAVEATIPDEVVRDATRVRLVDATPDDIRRRLVARSPDGDAVGHNVRPDALSVLRELALLWLADRVEEALDTYRDGHSLRDAPPTRERVIVALTGAPGGASLIRRAARIARAGRGDVIGVHVMTSDARQPHDQLHTQRQLLEELGGRFHEILGPDIAASLVAFARAHGATQLVVGATRRSRWARLVRGSIINDIVRHADRIDVHVIATDDAPNPLPMRTPSDRRVSTRRQAVGWAALIVGFPALTLALIPVRDHVGLTTVLLAYLLLTVAVSTAGGLLPATAAAVAGFLLGNRYFTEPLNTWQIDNVDDIVALFAFLAVALTVATLMRLTLRRTADAVQARSETDALLQAATALASEGDPLAMLLDHVRATFGLDAVSVLVQDHDRWRTEAQAGQRPPRRPDDASHTLDMTPGTVLALRGARLSGQELATLQAFAANISVVLERRDYEQGLEKADRLAAANDLRTALLRAVSHDLRTPLSSIKASVTSLIEPDVDWDQTATRHFLVTINEETDRLNRLVGNLLDASRLESGALQPNMRPVGLEDIVAAALNNLGPTGDDVHATIDETLPEVRTDPALLERAIANIIANARTHGATSQPVHVEAAQIGDRLDLIIADHGPGVNSADHERIFQPFQRHGDQHTATNVGLGLAVARGFIEAVDATISLEDTPGGGLTAVISLPVDVPAEPQIVP